MICIFMVEVNPCLGSICSIVTYFGMELHLLVGGSYLTCVDMQRCGVFYHEFLFFSGGSYLSRIYMHKDAFCLTKPYTTVQYACNILQYNSMQLHVSVSRFLFAESLYFCRPMFISFVYMIINFLFFWLGYTLQGVLKNLTCKYYRNLIVE